MKAAAGQALPAFDGPLSFVYLYLGEPDRVLQPAERAATIRPGLNAALPYLWSPEVAPARKTERFKALMRKAGVVDYWKVRGWPDMCHPTIGDDFACE
jgi:hypothetical protein